MIKKMVTCCVLFASIMLVGCGTTGTTVSTTGTSSAVGSKVQDVVAQYLPYIRPATSLVCNVVLQVAVSADDRVEKSNIINAISSAVGSLAGGNCPSVDQVSAAIASVAPDKAHWSNLTTSITGIYSGVFNQYIKGDAKAAADVLAAISLGCKDATDPYVTVTPTVTPIQ